MPTYMIDYRCYDKDGQLIKTGTLRVKNKIDKLSAKCSTEDYLKNKLPTFHRLIIDKCDEDFPYFNFQGTDGFDIFKDIFKT